MTGLNEKHPITLFGCPAYLVLDIGDNVELRLELPLRGASAELDMEAIAMAVHKAQADRRRPVQL